MANKKAIGIAAIVIAGAGLVALAARFNSEAAADRPQERSFAQQCHDAVARQHAPPLDALCLAAGYGPVVNGRAP
jgi:hypothetical protein